MYGFVYYLFLLVAAVAASTLKYDNHYTYSSNTPLVNLACSDGANGLITKYKVNTIGELRNKLKAGVYVAATPFVGGWNSPNCGHCYRARNPKNNKSFLFVGVDHSDPAVVSGTDAFSLVSPSGTTAEGALTVYLSELDPKECFKA